MVDTWELMEEVLQRIVWEPIVGIDAEWKPNFLMITEQYI